MTAKDVGEAIAYSMIEPWGEAREDLRAGIIACTIAQVHGNEDSRPSDFMPHYSPSETESEELSRKTLEAFDIGNHS